MTIKVQSGRLTAIAGTVNDVTVEAYVDTAAFLVVQVRSSDTTDKGPNNWQVRAITNATGDLTKIRFQNLNTNGEVTWWLVEAMNGEFTVERINDSIATAASSKAVALSKSYDTSRTMVVCSSRMSGSVSVPTTWLDASARSYTAAYLSTPSELTAVRIATSPATVTNNFTAYVIEWSAASGVTVDPKFLYDTYDQTVEYLALTAGIDPTLTWLYGTFAHNINVLEGVGTKLKFAGTGNDLISYERYDVASALLSGGSLYPVIFPADSGVVCTQGETTLSNTDTSKTITLGAPVHAASSVPVVFAACNGNTLAAGFPAQLLTAEFTNVDTAGMTNELTVDRDRTGQELDVSVFVVDFANAFLPGNLAAPLMMGHHV